MQRFLFCAALLLACKDKPSASAPAPSGTSAAPAATPSVGKDPCSLLTPAEIAAVVGNAVTVQKKDARYCRYDSGDPDKFDVALQYMHDDAARTCANVLPKVAGNPAGRIETIQGLADQAAWEWNPAGSEGTITVCKGKDVAL